MRSTILVVVASLGAVATGGAMMALTQGEGSFGAAMTASSAGPDAALETTFVQVIDGVRFTVLDAHRGVTFRGATFCSGMSPEEAAAFETAGRHPTPYVSITLLVEPGESGGSGDLRFNDPTWGWAMEPQPEGGCATPARAVVFKSETIIPGVERPKADEAFVVPAVGSKAELKTVRIYGPKLPEGPARFSVGLSRGERSMGTLTFGNVPIK